MKDNSSVLFWVKVYIVWKKKAHQSVKFQNFDCLVEISQNLCFDRFFVLKVYKISAKKVQRTYVSWYWRVMQNLKKKPDLLFQKWQEFGGFWSEHSKVSKICSLISPFCVKYITWPKTVQRSYLSWHWRVMQNLKRNWLVVWKMTGGIWEIFIGILESVIMILSWDNVVQGRKCMS